MSDDQQLPAPPPDGPPVPSAGPPGARPGAVVAWAVLAFFVLAVASVVILAVSLTLAYAAPTPASASNDALATAVIIASALVSIVPVVVSAVILRRARPGTNRSLWLGVLIGSGAQLLIFGGVCVVPIVGGGM